MIQTVTLTLQGRAAHLLSRLEVGLPRIMTVWLLLAMSACSLRVGLGVAGKGATGLTTAFPYILVTIAPLVSMGFALKWFAQGEEMQGPKTRLARYGHWRDVSLEEARAHPLFGAGGLMVSLLIGMLLNVPVRMMEYLVAIPAIAVDVPTWLSTLHLMATLDVVLLCSLYSIAFVAALKRAPIFPRLLVSIWIVDIAMQLVIAKMVAAQGLPASVAEPLHTLLDGNGKKVLISAAIWAPYLILSRRVNVTYRRRVEI
ncbi:DUF2569 family protein [Sphingomicrobium nitratireducens]|uniref:DUF2569 family protein n=1 Tax=Sphingomicrobium nitratireducens TaxID=2964666 RepID=UPI00223FC976|nr:DUF2569 family protein [Sphingomicrobium nitratireducens]